MTDVRLNVGIPAYFSPHSARPDWERLGRLAPGAIVVVNPNSGPAPGMHNQYRAAAAALRGRTVSVYGYVDAAYGERALRSIVDAARAYRRGFGADGVFLDQAPADSVGLTRLGRVATALRGLGMRTAINPGQPAIDPVGFARFDEVVTFEGSAGEYLRARIEAVPGGHARVWHLVYDVLPTLTSATVARAARSGVRLVYVTDRTLPNPWMALGAAWDRLLGDVRDISGRSRLGAGAASGAAA